MDGSTSASVILPPFSGNMDEIIWFGLSGEHSICHWKTTHEVGECSRWIKNELKQKRKINTIYYKPERDKNNKQDIWNSPCRTSGNVDCNHGLHIRYVFSCLTNDKICLNSSKQYSKASRAVSSAEEPKSAPSKSNNLTQTGHWILGSSSFLLLFYISKCWRLFVEALAVLKRWLHFDWLFSQVSSVWHTSGEKESFSKQQIHRTTPHLRYQGWGDDLLARWVANWPHAADASSPRVERTWA